MDTYHELFETKNRRYRHQQGKEKKDAIIALSQCMDGLAYRDREVRKSTQE